MRTGFQRLCLVMALLGLPALAPVKAGAQEQASQIADLIAAAPPCGYAIDEVKLGAWIEANVAADDLAFAGDLRLYAEVRTRDFEKMDQTTRAAFCIQARRAAKALDIAG